VRDGLEPVRSRPVQQSGLANVLLLNEASAAGLFFWHHVAPSAKTIVVNEHGPACFDIAVRCRAPLPLQVNLPPGVQLGFDTADGAKFGRAVRLAVAGARQIKALVVADWRTAPHLQALYAEFDPDLVVIGPHARALPMQNRRLKAAKLPVDMVSLGMGELQWFSDPEVGDLPDRLVRKFASLAAANAAVGNKTFDVDEMILAKGFFPSESLGQAKWAWTGSGATASVILPKIAGKAFRYTVFFYGHKTRLDDRHLQVRIDGSTVPSRYFPDEMKIEVEAPAPERACCVQLDLEHGELWPTPDGSRRLGCALYKIRVESLG
jgi:hypothetical protein